ncbi:hypothetical protein ANO11243_075260 [Dothideomycetidae sp. 11243]|nr:hypothetical protein ANO11243_075260 [fungal sp. No.11243]
MFTVGMIWLHDVCLVFDIHILIEFGFVYPCPTVCDSCVRPCNAMFSRRCPSFKRSPSVSQSLSVALFSTSFQRFSSAQTSAAVFKQASYPPQQALYTLPSISFPPPPFPERKEKDITPPPSPSELDPRPPTHFAHVSVLHRRARMRVFVAVASQDAVHCRADEYDEAAAEHYAEDED